MDKQLFIFSRTCKVDYGVMVSPASDFCPVEVKKFFKEQVRGLLNVDQYSPDLTTPRWLLSRVGDLTLWGVGCWNETHSEEFAADEAGRRHLRNFVGIVYQGDLQELPYEMDYFSAEFNKHVGKIWNMSRMDVQNQIAVGVSPADYMGTQTIKRGVAPGLNTMANRALTIEPARAESLIGSALVSKANVSIATNLLDVNLAFDERYQFLNASVINNPGGQVHTFKESSKIPSVVVNRQPSAPETKVETKPETKVESNQQTSAPTTTSSSPRPPKLEVPSVEEKRRSVPFRTIALVELLIIICLVIAYCAKSGSKETRGNDNKKEKVEGKGDKENKSGKSAKKIMGSDSQKLFGGGEPKEGNEEDIVDND